MSTIGIIGAGRIGQAIARTAVRAGRDVVIANSRDPASLGATVAALGAGVSAGTRAEAAAADIVFLAVPWTSVPAAVAELQWEGRVVVDATNALSVTFDNGAPTLTPAELGETTSSEIVAELVAGASVVKAANTLLADVLADDPRRAGGQLVLFLSGDDGDAKASVADFFADAGFFPVDLGDLAGGGTLQQFPAGPVVGSTFIKVP